LLKRLYLAAFERAAYHAQNELVASSAICMRTRRRKTGRCEISPCR